MNFNDRTKKYFCSYCHRDLEELKVDEGITSQNLQDKINKQTVVIMKHLEGLQAYTIHDVDPQQEIEKELKEECYSVGVARCEQVGDRSGDTHGDREWWRRWWRRTRTRWEREERVTSRQRVYELCVAGDGDPGEYYRRGRVNEQQAATTRVDSAFLSGEEHGG